MEGIYNFHNAEKRDAYSATVEAILLDKSRKRICAFSERFDDELMWAHYAGQSQGICIRFDTRHLVENLAGVNVSLEKVAYRKRPTRVRNHDDEAVRKILSQKSLRWAGEREWRLIFDAPSMPVRDVGQPLEIGNAISRVYIGTRVKLSHRDALISAVQYKNRQASFYEMKIDGYDMRFEQTRVLCR